MRLMLCLLVLLLAGLVGCVKTYSAKMPMRVYTEDHRITGVNAVRDIDLGWLITNREWSIMLIREDQKEWDKQ